MNGKISSKAFQRGFFFRNFMSYDCFSMIFKVSENFGMPGFSDRSPAAVRVGDRRQLLRPFLYTNFLSLLPRTI